MLVCSTNLKNYLEIKMGKFNGKITAEFTPPKTWVLEKALSFQTDKFTTEDVKLLEEVGVNITNTGRITCKKGMSTDLASTPRLLWNLIAPWDVARAAIIHDHLYASLRSYYSSQAWSKPRWRMARALSDKVFLLGMLSANPSVPKWKIYSAYWSVRVFGRWPASAKDA